MLTKRDLLRSLTSAEFLSRRCRSIHTFQSGFGIELPGWCADYEAVPSEGDCSTD
jgi:hypothetical protein